MNSIHNYRISIRKHIKTKPFTMLKNASKLLKENTQKIDHYFESYHDGSKLQ